MYLGALIFYFIKIELTLRGLSYWFADFFDHSQYFDYFDMS